MSFQERGILGGTTNALKNPRATQNGSKTIDLNDFEKFTVKPIVRDNTSTNRIDEKKYSEFEINIPVNKSEGMLLTENTSLLVALAKTTERKIENIVIENMELHGFVDTPHIRNIKYLKRSGKKRENFYLRIVNPIANTMILGKETILFVGFRKATPEENASNEIE